MSQPQTPTPNNNNHNLRNIRKDSAPPLHSIPSRSLFPSLLLADLFPLSHHSRRTQLGQIVGETAIFRYELKELKESVGFWSHLWKEIQRSTIFLRDWEGFGSFLHLELECGSRLRFLGLFWRFLFKGECAGGLRSYRWEAFFGSRKMVCCFDYSPSSCIFFNLIAFCLQCVGKLGFLPFKCNARWNLNPLRKLCH